MNIRTAAHRSFVALAGAVIFVTTMASTSPANAQDSDGQHTRPCFMIRSNWNTAPDGPQPTCPVPTWQETATTPTHATKTTGTGEKTTVDSSADRPSRATDFMP